MKKRNFILLLLFICISLSCSTGDHTKELKILQINLWHGTTSVPDGFSGLVSIIEQTDPDVVLLCEVRNQDNWDFISRLVDTLKVAGKIYYGEPTNQSTGIISKYKIDDQQSCCYPDKSGPIVKAHITVEDKTLTIYSAHLDYTHYECYLPRGYSGTTWEKLDAPVNDADSVLTANRLSQRDEAIVAFMEDAKTEIAKGNLIFLGGDFNEPSHLDWQADTKELREHNGLIINWDCSVMLTDMGMIDSYRKIYPDAVKYPGFTFPSPNPAVELKKLTWAPEADERDRIDFIYYYPDTSLSLKDAKIVGPSETIIRGKVGSNDSLDEFIIPKGIWPTDHKANLAIFNLSVNPR